VAKIEVVGQFLNIHFSMICYLQIIFQSSACWESIQSHSFHRQDVESLHNALADFRIPYQSTFGNTFILHVEYLINSIMNSSLLSKELKSKALSNNIKRLVILQYGWSELLKPFI